MQIADIQEEFRRLIADVRAISEDLATTVEELLHEGRDNPLTTAEATRLLTVVIKRVKQSAERNGDGALGRALAGDIDTIVQRVIGARTRIGGPVGARLLVAHNGVEPKKVEPTPRFHGRDVPMRCGYVETSDIELWEHNARLEIHVAHFKRLRGRSPSARELLQILLAELRLPGMSQGDEFKIEELARSIAANGVQKPPILDIDGTVLDGNRRIAACNLILASDDFTADEKRRVQRIFVWQLTEFADADDRDAVAVALNFEPDRKQDWPDYVRARKIDAAWKAMIEPWPQPPGERQQQELRKELARRFALEAKDVTRYLKMVDLALEFEEYHVQTRGRDEDETRYRASEEFQYFDELTKGKAPGGVLHALGQDETLKHVTFDLLFDGKFRNWTLVRNLKYVNDAHLLEALVKARNNPDVERAKDIVETTLTLARSRSQEAKTVGINVRIEAFVELLEQMSARTVRDGVKPELLMKLRDALQLVDGLIEKVLEERAAQRA